MVWNWMPCVCISKKQCPTCASSFSTSAESLLNLVCKRNASCCIWTSKFSHISICCNWVWPEIDAREVPFKLFKEMLMFCQPEAFEIAAFCFYHELSWEGLFNLKFASGSGLILENPNMPMRMLRSAQVSGGSSFSKASKLDLAGVLPLGVSSTPTNSKIPRWGEGIYTS